MYGDDDNYAPSHEDKNSGENQIKVKSKWDDGWAHIDLSITKEPGVFHQYQHLSISLNFCAVIFLGLQLFIYFIYFCWHE